MSMMTCPHCHSEIPQGASVCSGCQAKIKYDKVGYLGQIVSTFLVMAGKVVFAFLALVIIGDLPHEHLLALSQSLFGKEWPILHFTITIPLSCYTCYLLIKYLFISLFYWGWITFKIALKRMYRRGGLF